MKRMIKTRDDDWCSLEEAEVNNLKILLVGFEHPNMGWVKWFALIKDISFTFVPRTNGLTIPWVKGQLNKKVKTGTILDEWLAA